MTTSTTTGTASAPGPPPDPSRLVRDPSDRVVAGVCAAFARATGTDPVLWRVAVAVLAFFGGAGVALYLLGWVLVPRLGTDRAPAERLLRGTDGRLRPFGLVLLVLAGAVLLGLVDNGPATAALLVLAAVAFLAWRERRPAPGAGTAAPGADLPPSPTPAWGGGLVAEPSLAPRERRSALGLLTLGLAALVAGVLSVLATAGVDGIGAVEVLAAALLVVGLGLVVGARWGRARWLAVVAAALSLAMMIASASAGTVGAGDRRWLATDGGRYALSLGEAVLDLSQLQPGDEVQARLGVGALVVLVPEELGVAVDARLGLGELTRLDLDGTRLDLTAEDPFDRRLQFLVGNSTDEPVRLDLAVRVGEIEVRRVPS